MKRSSTANDAIHLLKQDHDKVKKLFKQFEGAEKESQWENIAEEAIKELKIHALIEEEIFYPALRELASEDEETSELLNEANEEHHVAKVLIREIEELDASDEAYCAKFTVLAENVKHHIQEEEGDLFPYAKKKKLDASIAERMQQRKAELEANPQQLEQLVEV